MKKNFSTPFLSTAINIILIFSCPKNEPVKNMDKPSCYEFRKGDDHETKF